MHVSEIGAPHLVDPSRLERSARRLYGDAFDELWGELAPVPEREHPGRRRARARPRVLPGPGHASHHVCYFDGETLYAGDAAGVRIQPHASVLPPTPPPDIDVEAWHRTLERDRALRAGAAGAGPLRRRDGRQRHLAELRAAARHVGAIASRPASSEEEFVAAARPRPRAGEEAGATTTARCRSGSPTPA